MAISVRIVSYFIENLRIQVVRNLKYFIIILLFVLYIETFKCLIERRILKTRENFLKKKCNSRRKRPIRLVANPWCYATIRRNVSKVENGKKVSSRNYQKKNRYRSFA